MHGKDSQIYIIKMQKSKCYTVMIDQAYAKTSAFYITMKQKAKRKKQQQWNKKTYDTKPKMLCTTWLAHKVSKITG